MAQLYFARCYEILQIQLKFSMCVVANFIIHNEKLTRNCKKQVSKNKYEQFCYFQHNFVNNILDTSLAKLFSLSSQPAFIGQEEQVVSIIIFSSFA